MPKILSIIFFSAQLFLIYIFGLDFLEMSRLFGQIFFVAVINSLSLDTFSGKTNKSKNFLVGIVSFNYSIIYF